MDPMPAPALRRLLLAALPALAMLGVGLSTLFGPGGLIRYQSLQDELTDATDDLAALERDNQALILQLSTLESDPVAIERAVADELGYARQGSTLYRFE